MKLSTVAQKNASTSQVHERIVIVGGTQGIGEGIAYRFAEAGAEVWFVGRNESKAKSVLERLNAISSEKKTDHTPQHAFLRADLSLVSEAKRIAGDIRTRAGTQGIDHLVMSQGGPSNGKFVGTSENHDAHYAVQVLSRFVIAHELAGDPSSSTVKKSVMSVMAPGNVWRAVDKDDLELRQPGAGENSITIYSRDSLVINAFTEDLAKSNPNVTFTHVFPGPVKTNILRNSPSPWYISSMLWAVTAIAGISAREYAEIPFYLLVHPEGRELTAREMFTDNKLNRIKMHACFRDDGVRDKIRSHLLEVLDSQK